MKVLEEIQQIAKQNQARHKSKKVRTVTENKVKVGECFRQGDLYLFRVKNDHPVGNELKIRQIADGVSLGARHVLVGGFKVYEGKEKPTALGDIHARVSVGYTFDVFESVTLTHPEHDNYVIDFPSRWQVVHQIDLRTLARAAD